MSDRRLGLKVSIALVAVLVAYYALEAAYRARMLWKRLHTTPIWVVESPIYAFDRDIGYRYLPDRALQLRLIDHRGNVLLANRFAINNAGHVSSRDDSVEKKASEFRVGLIGDSMTASLTNDVPWPELLERRLNGDAELLGHTGKSSFKVVNFGMDGTGIEQWESVFQREVARFHPDLVVVNFITADIRRRFVWRSTSEVALPEDRSYQLTFACVSLPVSADNPDCTVSWLFAIPRALLDDAASRKRIRRDVVLRARRTHWFSPYPEVLAKVLGYRPPFEWTIFERPRSRWEYGADDEALVASARVLRLLRGRASSLFLHNPTYEEIVSDGRPPLVVSLGEMAGNVEITFMKERLPRPALDSEVMRWFRRPHDDHFTDEGAVVYAEAVYGVVRDALISAPAAE